MKTTRRKVRKISVYVLDSCPLQEVSNAIEIANDTQDSFKFIYQPEIIKIDLSAFKKQNDAYDFSQVIKKTTEFNFAHLFDDSPDGVIIVTSLPYTEDDLIDDYLDDRKNLDQYLFYDAVKIKNKRIEVISTYIWERLPNKSNPRFKRTSSGRRVLEPYLLLMFASCVLDLKKVAPYHEDTRSCPFDYCNEVKDIDKTFKKGKICDECAAYIQNAIDKKQITDKIRDSVMQLYSRAFKKPPYEYDLAISYAGEDYEYANQIYRPLEAAGFCVFFAGKNQDLLFRPLEENLRDIFRYKSRYCLILISHNYVLRQPPHVEVQVALERETAEMGNIYIIPVRLDDTFIPGFPEDLVYLDARTDHDMKRVARIVLDFLKSNSS
jgi:hypothetical protein